MRRKSGSGRVVCFAWCFLWLVGLLAFKICPVDHHSENAVLEGENHGFGGGLGDRAGVTGHSQSGIAPADDQVVLVVELEAGNRLRLDDVCEVAQLVDLERRALHSLGVLPSEFLFCESPCFALIAENGGDLLVIVVVVHNHDVFTLVEFRASESVVRKCVGHHSSFVGWCKAV